MKAVISIISFLKEKSNKNKRESLSWDFVPSLFEIAVIFCSQIAWMNTVRATFLLKSDFNMLSVTSSHWESLSSKIAGIT